MTTSTSSFTSSTEIRKLNPSHISNLSGFLEYAEEWRKLMSLIPKYLEKHNFECGITPTNEAKYNTDHFRLIETASIKFKRPATEILLDEWGCSGKVRPALGHLLHLLIKAELFRAADYVSINILNQEPPERPRHGPAARVPVNLDEIQNKAEIEDLLQNLTYSSSIIQNKTPYDVNLNKDVSKDPIPVIIITPDADEVREPEFVPRQAVNKEPEHVSGYVPELSSLLDNPPQNLMSTETTITSICSSKSDLSNDMIDKEDNAEYIPELSSLLNNPLQNLLSTQSTITSFQSSKSLKKIKNADKIKEQTFLPHQSKNKEPEHISEYLPELSSLLNNSPQNLLSTQSTISSLHSSRSLKIIETAEYIPELSSLLNNPPQNLLSTQSTITSSYSNKHAKTNKISDEIGEPILASGQTEKKEPEHISEYVPELSSLLDNPPQNLMSTQSTISAIYSSESVKSNEIEDCEINESSVIGDSEIERKNSLPPLSFLIKEQTIDEITTSLNKHHRINDFSEGVSLATTDSDNISRNTTSGESVIAEVYNQHIISSDSENMIPHLSSLISSSAVKTSDIEIPSFSKILTSKDGESLNSYSNSFSTDTSLPDLSNFISDENDATAEKDNETCTSRSGDFSGIPDISNLLLQENVKSPIPNFSDLLPGTSSAANVQFCNSEKLSHCVSPLPNLSLNTNLPHFAYSQLKSSTNNFNEVPYTTLDNPGRLLGSGAFGMVFLGVGLFKDPVAVKKFLLGNVEVVKVDDDVTRRFQNEVENLSNFRHENLLSLLGYSCDGCTYCLIYEYISGGTLKDRLKNVNQKLHWKERLSIALGTAKAISYLHIAKPPLIHRDIKTANILLDSSNNPKLGDFGIIKLMNRQSTTTGTVIGTSAYMAPEALRGDISPKCDTFSFGVVLLELLTSLPTFDENRDGLDLLTHVEEKCEDFIEPLLDKSVGSWIENNVNFGEELFVIAKTKCLEEKKKRLLMVDVTKELEELHKKLN